MTIRALLAALTLLILAPAVSPAAAQTANAVQTWPNLREGDVVLKDFAFASGEILPELGTLEAGVKRIKNARYVIVPGKKETHGHFTHLRSAFWKSHLAEFMKELGE